MSCKHADLMMIYAGQAAEMDEPWKLWELRSPGFKWITCNKHPEWRKENEYRQIPKTISINGFEVPEPMREKPEIGDHYWCIDPSEDELCDLMCWDGDSYDMNRFKNGLCHLTRDNCIAHAKALFSFSEEE